MSRRRTAKKRQVISGAESSIVITKFINNLMLKGKKSLAEKITYGAFNIVENKYKIDPLEAFNNAIENIKPLLEINSVRVGGSKYQVPTPVEEPRALTLAIRWLIKASRNRSEKKMILRLAAEINEARNNKGGAVKIKEDIHKMAEANKAFAHYSPHKRKKDRSSYV